MRKYLLRKRSFAVDICILNNFSAKKVAVPKSNCCVNEVTLNKCEKVASPKIKLSFILNNLSAQKVAVPKSNCCVEEVILNRCEGVAFPKIKLS